MEPACSYPLGTKALRHGGEGLRAVRSFLGLRWELAPRTGQVPTSQVSKLALSTGGWIALFGGAEIKRAYYEPGTPNRT